MRLAACRHRDTLPVREKVVCILKRTNGRDWQFLRGKVLPPFQATRQVHRLGISLRFRPQLPKTPRLVVFSMSVSVALAETRVLVGKRLWRRAPSRKVSVPEIIILRGICDKEVGVFSVLVRKPSAWKGPLTADWSDEDTVFGTQKDEMSHRCITEWGRTRRTPGEEACAEARPMSVSARWCTSPNPRRRLRLDDQRCSARRPGYVFRR